MRSHARASFAGLVPGTGSSRRFPVPAIAVRAFGIAFALLGLLALNATVSSADYSSAGEFGSGTLSDPQRVAVNQEADQVLVVDRGNDRVLVYEDSGTGPAPGSITLLGEFGAGLLSDPVGIAINQAQDYIYVTDAGNERIVRFDVTDLAIFDPASVTAVDLEFGSVGTGCQAGVFATLAVGIAIDPTTDDVLVPDRAGCVQRFEADGTHVSNFDGSDGGTQFTQTADPSTDTLGPRDVGVDSTGSIYVAEAYTPGQFGGSDGKLQKFSSAGAWEATLIEGVPQGQPSASRSQGVVSVGPDNNDVFAPAVVNEGFFFSNIARVRQFSSAGAELSSFAIDEINPMRTGIAVNSSLERAYVVENDTNRVLVFAPAVAPEVETGSADPRWTTATLNGFVDPNSNATTWQFKYGTTPGGPYPDLAPATPQSGGTGDGPLAQSAQLTGLQPATTYYFRLSASNAGGSDEGEEVSFTTLAEAPPDAHIDPVTDLTPHTATFNGTVNPQGPVSPPSPSTRFRFEYKRAADSTWIPVPVSGSDDLGHGTDPVAVSQAVDELPANTLFDVRLVATKDEGAGADMDTTQFTTVPRAPQITASGASADETGATLRGQLRPHNSTADYRFEYGTTTAYGELVEGHQVGPQGDAATFGNALSVSERLDGLAPDTTYHFRLVASNATGTVTGPDQTFTTRGAEALPPTPPLSAYGQDRFELVTPADAGSYEVLLSPTGIYNEDNALAEGNTQRSRLLSSPSGDHFGYSLGAQATLPGMAPDGDIPDPAIASRGQSGWETTVPAGDRSGLGCGIQSTSPTMFGLSVNGDRELYTTGCFNDKKILSDGLDATAGSTTFAIDAKTGASTLVSARFGIQGPLPTEVENASQEEHIGGSADLSSLYFAVSLGLLPGVPAVDAAFRTYIYKRVDLGVPELVTRTATGVPFGIEYADRSGPNRFEVTEDGDAIVLGAPPGTAMVAEDTNDVRDVYRVGDDQPTWISDPASVPSSNRPSPQPAAERSFEGASADGSVVYFSTVEAFTADDTDSARDIYVYDFGQPAGSRIGRVSTAEIACGSCSDSFSDANFVAHSSDGSRAFFLTEDVLSGEDNDAQVSLYVSAPASSPTYVAPAGDSRDSEPEPTIFLSGTLIDPFDLSFRPIKLADDGRVGVFSLATDVSLPAGRGGPDTDSTRDRFIWREDGGPSWQDRLRRIPQGIAPDANTTSDPGIDCYLLSAPSQPSGRPNKRSPGCRGMSADGRLVFFQSVEPLIAEDPNEIEDVYAIDTTDGSIEMISPPTETSFSLEGPRRVAAIYADNSASGDTVFFASRESIDPSRDKDDGWVDVYVARTGEVLPPFVPRVPCEGDDCQPAAANSPAFTAPGSASLNGPGNLAKKPKPRKCPKGKVKRKGKCIKKHRANDNRRAGR